MAKTAKKNEIAELKVQLRDGKLQRLYLFYGDEEYLKELYIGKIEELVPDGGFEDFNRIKIQGTTSYEVYDDALEGMPMMADRRIVEIRDSNIFTVARSKDVSPPDDKQKKFWLEKFKRLQDDTVLIFCEKKADARSALFKAAAKAGMKVNCEYLSVSDLKSWVIKKTLKAGKKIDGDVAEYLVSVIDPGLNNLEHEMNKLLNFCGDIIYKSDVDRVVSKALGIKVFDITDGIAEGNAEKVFSTVNDLKTQKESAFGLLYLIYSNASKMLRLKLAKATNKFDARKVLGGNPWMAEKCLRASARFSENRLMRMTLRVPEIDMEIKNGTVSEWQALEMYLFECMRRDNDAA